MRAQIDTTTLRKVAAVRGLVCDAVRARVWPTLLGASAGAAELETHSHKQHRDKSTVACDVERSLWCIQDEDERATKRAELMRILNGVVAKHAHSGCCYYQGLHDVASVLLLVAGESAAGAMLEQLALNHLRDCTRATLEPVTELLNLLFPLIQRCDPELAAFLQRSGVLPFFALSWLLTWHAHQAGVASAARLFDLFIASNPIMPLYVGAAALLEERRAVLAMPCDGAELHRFLTGLDVLGRLSADELAVRRCAFCHPPRAPLMPHSRRARSPCTGCIRQQRCASWRACSCRHTPP